MKHELPELPYPKNALEPHISAETLEYHHGKHHRAYVNKLNELIQGRPEENMSLEELVLKSEPGPIFNNAAQDWNHTFYWQCLTPQSSAPQGELADAIKRDFGSLEAFQEQFKKAGIGQFGSGWAWLVADPKNRKLSIVTTSNAENPMRKGLTPLLVADVWEHAYYIDYRNARDKFLDSSFKIMNWRFAEKNFRSLASAAA